VQFWAPDDGRKTRLKHVDRLTEINNLRKVASCWLYSANILAMHGRMNVKFKHNFFFRLYFFFSFLPFHFSVYVHLFNAFEHQISLCLVPEGSLDLTSVSIKPSVHFKVLNSLDFNGSLPAVLFNIQ